jgi:hypothetical protein
MDVITQFEHFHFNAVPLELLNKDNGIFRDALNLLVKGRNKEAEERFLVFIFSESFLFRLSHCQN